MKKTIFSLFVLCACMLQTTAQTVEQNEPILIYAMPKTVLVFDVQIEKIQERVGKFYLYSQRYLQTSDVITENKTWYEIKNISMRTKTIADEQRKFKVVPNKDLNTTYLTLDGNGILAGINYDVPFENTISETEEVEIPTKEITSTFDLPMFNEEQILANSISKMAAITAKQIYRLRDSRINWITGDVDQLPADGASMQAILDELSETERALCELFVGKTIKENFTETIEFVPTDAVNNHVLFRLSNQNGLVPSDDLSGTPVFLSIAAQKPSYRKLTAEELKDKGKTKSENMPAVFYNLPGKAKVSVKEGTNCIFTTELIVPQFGVNVSLPKNMFLKAETKVLFDTKTGVILDLKKDENLEKK